MYKWKITVITYCIETILWAIRPNSQGMSSIKLKVVQWQGLFNWSNDMVSNETTDSQGVEISWLSRDQSGGEDGYSLT